MYKRRLTKPVRLRLVEVSRKKGLESPVIGHWWPTVGRIALLSELDQGLELNGLTFMAKAQIGSMKSAFPKRQFYSAAIGSTVNGSIVRLRASVNCTDDWQHVIAWIYRRTVLVAVHCELEDPDICYVGLVVSSGAESISLQPISSNGKWIVPSQLIKLSAISKIEIGNRYLHSFSRYINSSKMYEKKVR